MAAAQPQLGGGVCDVDYSCRTPWYEEAVASTSNIIHRPPNGGDIARMRELARLEAYDRPLDNVSLDLCLLGAGSALRFLCVMEGGNCAYTMVSHWGSRGLKSCDRVMRGRKSYLTYVLSGMMQPRWFPGGNLPATFQSGEEFLVLPRAVKWPSGWGYDGAWKGLLGQRRYLA